MLGTQGNKQDTKREGLRPEQRPRPNRGEAIGRFWRTKPNQTMKVCLILGSRGPTILCDTDTILSPPGITASSDPRLYTNFLSAAQSGNDPVTAAHKHKNLGSGRRCRREEAFHLPQKESETHFHALLLRGVDLRE